MSILYLGSKGRLLERNCRRSRMFSSCNSLDEEAIEKSRDYCLCMCQIEKLVILVFLVVHSAFYQYILSMIFLLILVPKFLWKRYLIFAYFIFLITFLTIRLTNWQ